MTSKPIAVSTAEVRIRPDIDEGVVKLYAEAVRLRDYAEARAIATDDDVKTATNDLVVIVGVKKALEAERVAYTGPMNEHLKAINAFFKDFVEPIMQADKVTRDKVTAYRRDQDAKRVEQERINALRVEAARAEMELAGELSEPVNLVPVEPEAPVHYRASAGMIGTAKVWKFEVEDFAALPDDYKTPDMVRIRKVVTAGATIPGVKAWQEEQLRVTK